MCGGSGVVRFVSETFVADFGDNLWESKKCVYLQAISYAWLIG